MSIRLYSTLTRQLEVFSPQNPGEARVYVCGMTVYDYAHAGNARSAVVFDVLTRHLAARGHRVTYVRNMTDVDDKIVERAKLSGEQPLELSARMAPIYQADMRELGCQDPTHEPKVSENIPAIVALIEKIVANGHAYVVTMPSGFCDVYFAVRSLPSYGKLSRRNIDELEVGARVAKDESKRDPLDFALWKGCGEDGWGFESPWGKGRPGWHIECSAMSLSLLGYGFDIHGGGMDLIFPHHENEIAQSEAASPDEGEFAHLWMHNGFLNVDKEKMSKSMGNVIKPRDIYRRNDPEALRYVFLSVHYRGPLSFDIGQDERSGATFPTVDEAERRVDYLYSTLERTGGFEAGPFDARRKELTVYRKAIEGAEERVLAALDDDLNTPVALAHLGELAKAINELCDMLQKRKQDATLVSAGEKLGEKAHQALRRGASHMGLLLTAPSVYRARTLARRLTARGLTCDAIEAKLVARAEARAAKDFARADALRAELDALSVDVSDSPAGSTYSIRV